VCVKLQVLPAEPLLVPGHARDDSRHNLGQTGAISSRLP
jgi:hypothetical protein